MFVLSNVVTTEHSLLDMASVQPNDTSQTTVAVTASNTSDSVETRAGVSAEPVTHSLNNDTQNSPGVDSDQAAELTTAQHRHDNTSHSSSDISAQSPSQENAHTSESSPTVTQPLDEETQTISSSATLDSPTTFQPAVQYHTEWMDYFLHAHHFEGQYLYDEMTYLFRLLVQYRSPRQSDTLVVNFYDEDGASMEMNGNISIFIF